VEVPVLQLICLSSVCLKSGSPKAWNWHRIRHIEADYGMVMAHV